MPENWMAVMICPVCPSDTANVQVYWKDGCVSRLIFTCIVCGLETVEDYENPLDVEGI